MPFEIEFVWQDKEYRAVASRHRQNGVPYWRVLFPSGRYYDFMWKDREWVHLEYEREPMPDELKNTICRAFERHPQYRAEMER